MSFNALSSSSAQSLLISPPIMVTHQSILLLEDSPGERELFRLALAQTGIDVALYTEQDAEDAFQFLGHLAPHVPGCAPGGVTGAVSTARIERGPSQAARSASTETMPAASHSSISISIPEGGLNRSPTARNIPPSQPSARQDALVPERGHSSTARCASTGDRSGPPHSLPSLILLDLHLRGQDGCDFLKRLRSDARFASLPIVIFTTSNDPTDLARCYANGANGYVLKPGTFAELVRCTGDICRYWLDRNLAPHLIGTPC